MLTSPNIESELSYAYLHAVAAKAGFACEYRSRHADHAGIDATVIQDGSLLARDSRLSYVSVDVQLKATYQAVAEDENRFSFSLPKRQYEKLRSTNLCSPRILIILRLPKDPQEWLVVTEEMLAAKRCAYWVSLYDAPPIIEGRSSITVYVPKRHQLSPENLTALMTRFSRQEVVRYEP